MPGKKKLNILVFPNDISSGCYWYRTHIPCKYLKKLGHNIRITQKIPVIKGTKKIHPKDLAWADVIWFQRYYMDHPGIYVSIVEFAKKHKKVLAYDMDDILDAEVIPTHNPVFPQIVLPSTQSLIKYFLQQADVKTAASLNLANKHKIDYVPNSIDYELWDDAKKIKGVKRDKLCVGFAGGGSHYHDLKMIEPVLKKFIDKGQIEVVLFGIPSPFDFQCETVKFCRFNRYPYKLKKLGIDIAIAPLNDEVFNDYKSSIKWEEYSALGIVSIVSNKRPYFEVKHGTTGYICNDTKDWEENLTLLINDNKLRSRIGKQACNWVKKRYNAEDNAVTWEKLFLDSFNKLNK